MKYLVSKLINFPGFHFGIKGRIFRHRFWSSNVFRGRILSSDNFGCGKFGWRVEKKLDFEKIYPLAKNKMSSEQGNQISSG